MARFEIKPSVGLRFYFVLKADNGETVLKSETYNFKSSCKDGIESVKVNSPYDIRYDRRTAVNGQYYFNLKAGNGEIIGTSEMYVSSTGRDNGIEVVKRVAPTASTVDLT